MNRKTLAYWILIALVASLGLAAHAQTFSVIHLFDIQVEGAFPTAGVTLRAGVLYGTTSEANQASNGNVYQITNLGSDFTYTPIFLFPSDRSGGSMPGGRVVFGPDGHLYGTTIGGGGMYNSGVVFTLTPPASVCKTAACGWGLSPSCELPRRGRDFDLLAFLDEQGNWAYRRS